MPPDEKAGPVQQHRAGRLFHRRSWRHELRQAARPDPEQAEFASRNASGGGALVFGRITYQMMAGFRPSGMARRMMPQVADGMNAARKFVFSRTLASADWNNTTRGNFKAAMFCCAIGRTAPYRHRA
jgi:dihydrofolate reductase